MTPGEPAVTPCITQFAAAIRLVSPIRRGTPAPIGGTCPGRRQAPPRGRRPDGYQHRMDLPAHPGNHRPGSGDPDWSAMTRVLVVRPDNVGDVIMTVPALRALRAAAPRARLELLASPAGAAAAPLVAELDDVVVASVSWQRLPSVAEVADPDPDADLVATLAARHYDAAVVLTSFSQSPWPAATVCRRAGIPVRVGTSKEFGGDALTHWVSAPPDDGHQVDRALEVLAAVGVPSLGADLAVTVPADAGSPRPAGRYVVVAPGASCPSRRWGPSGSPPRAAGSPGWGGPWWSPARPRRPTSSPAAADGVDGAVRLVGELDLARAGRPRGGGRRGRREQLRRGAPRRRRRHPGRRAVRRHRGGRAVRAADRARRGAHPPHQPARRAASSSARSTRSASTSPRSGWSTRWRASPEPDVSDVDHRGTRPPCPRRPTTVTS